MADARTHGSVRLPSGRGELLLRDADERVIRLAWNEEGGTDRRRSLPAGTYTLVTERFAKKSADGSLWHTSSTIPKGRELVVEAGEELTLDANSEVRITRSWRGGMVGMNIQSHDGAGLSLYKDGKRIPIRYELLDADGKVWLDGKMNYG